MYEIFSFCWMLTAYHKYSLPGGRTKAKSVHLANPRSQCKGHSTLPLFFFFWVLCLTVFFNRILRWDSLYLCTEIFGQSIVWRWYFKKITLSCLFCMCLHCFYTLFWMTISFQEPLLVLHFESKQADLNSFLEHSRLFVVYKSAFALNTIKHTISFSLHLHKIGLETPPPKIKPSWTAKTYIACACSLDGLWTTI